MSASRALAELVAQLAVQRGRELVALDEAAPPGAAHPVERRHGTDGRAAPARQLATQGGGFPTSCGRAARRASRARPATRPSPRRRRVGVGQHAAARGLELDDDPLDLGVVGRQRGPHPARHGELLRKRRDEPGLAGIVARAHLREPPLDPLRRRVGQRLAQQPRPRGRVLQRGQRAPRRRAAAEPGAAARMPRSLRRAGSSGSTTRAAAAATPPHRARAPLSKRSAGSLASARAITASNASEPGRAEAARTGAPRASARADSSPNTTRPVSAKYSTQPSEYRSLAGPADSPRIRSGAT